MIFIWWSWDYYWFLGRDVWDYRFFMLPLSPTIIDGKLRFAVSYAFCIVKVYYILLLQDLMLLRTMRFALSEMPLIYYIRVICLSTQSQSSLTNNFSTYKHLSEQAARQATTTLFCDCQSTALGKRLCQPQTTKEASKPTSDYVCHKWLRRWATWQTITQLTNDTIYIFINLLNLLYHETT